MTTGGKDVFDATSCVTKTPASMQRLTENKFPKFATGFSGKFAEVPILWQGRQTSPYPQAVSEICGFAFLHTNWKLKQNSKLDRLLKLAPQNSKQITFCIPISRKLRAAKCLPGDKLCNKKKVSQIRNKI